jgi:hypothetical protein
MIDLPGPVPGAGDGPPDEPEPVSRSGNDVVVNEIERRSSSVLGRVAGNTVSPGVQALLILAGFDPATATFAGALAGSLTEEGVSLLTAWAQLRTERLERFVHVTEAAADADIDTVFDAVTQDPAKLQLLALAVENAARSSDEWKVDLLARLFVHGSAGGDKVDTARLIMRTLRDLEAVHLPVLKALEGTAGPFPDYQVAASYARTADDLAKAGGPDRQDVIHLVLGQLRASGLILEVVQTDAAMASREGTDQVGYRLTPFGDLCCRHLVDQHDRTDGPDASG